MAQGRPIYRYEPNNSNPDRAVGILLPFNKAAEGRVETQNELSGSINGGSLFRQSYTTEEQALTNFMKNKNLTVAETMLISGHSDPKILLKIYNNLQLKDVVEKINNIGESR